MKLTFKDLKQQKFFIEAEPSETIATLKEKISTEKGWEVAQQKLIYSGKILQDQNTIGSYNIEEKGFIVCMISKPKAPPADKEAAGSSASTPKKVAPSTPAHQATPLTTPAAPSAAPSAAPRAQNVPETPSPAGAAVAAAATPEPAAAPSFNDPSALAMGPQREAAIQNMLEMGYERENIDRAMRAAFYNPDRAVEYLLMGIPEHLQQEQRQPPRQAATEEPAANPASPPAAVSPASAAAEGENVNLFEAAANAARQRQQGGGAGAGAGLGNLEFLRNNPQFQQLRQVVQQQPQMLEPILQQVSQGNPGLAALINQNQEQFLQLLGENSDNDDDGPGGAMPPGTHQVVVTEEERQAIERLCRLGFERDLVIQAYFAFDKNEELAANFLFEQPEGDDE
ncbi:nucleotide excision repair protein RAD23 [Tirmania nivea]|nr:nucleotide excision repair protein RAD23 [Tirmania nivea]